MRTGFHLGGKGLQIGLGRFGLRMNFGVSRDFNFEVVTGFSANESDQIAGVLKLATGAIAAGQITAQGHQTLDAHLLELLQLFTHAVTRSADA